MADDADKKVSDATDDKLAFEEWGKRKKVDAWKVSAAKHLRSWPIGFEVTEAAFDQAVNDACTHVMR